MKRSHNMMQKRPSAPYVSDSNPELGSAIDDLLVSKSRSLVLLTALFFLASSIIISGESDTHIMAQLFGLGILFGLVSYAAYSMMEERYLIANIVWQAGLLAVILAVYFLFRNAEILLLAAFLPLISAITLGWHAGVITELILIGLLVWVNSMPDSALMLGDYVLIIPFMGAFGGLLGWVTTRHLTTAAAWALYSFNQARDNLRNAREQRMELQQTQEDLTHAYQELARMTSRLKSLQRIAEESRQAKANFVANVSHELRTPLNMIIGYTEVITRSPGLYGGHLPAALMTDITAIQRNSKHLLNLVNDVLDLSQVESGRMALSCEWTDINALVQEAASIVEGFFESKGLYLKLEVAPNLPEVYCDRTRIRQVIINILSNAGRFTRVGGVVIKSQAVNEQLQVSIADTGPGIPIEDQKRIFEPFQQLDNSIRRPYDGSGLGLTISKQFIEMHDGKMSLESAPGQGTTFFFTLPLTPALAETDFYKSPPVQRSLLPGDTYGYRLRTRPSKARVPEVVPRLVVYEKDQSMQRMLSRYLAGTEVVSARSMSEVAAAVNHSPAQAIVVNTSPQEQLSDQILSFAPIGTPVISCWLPGEVEAANQLGAVQYLMKPITREKLLEVLEALPGQPGFSGEFQRIMLVDDEPDELHLFARMLESAPQGYQIIQASNGKRALDMLRSRPVDIILLDLVMPVFDGYQFLEVKRHDPAIRDIPAIVISSRDPLGEAIASNTVHISHNGGFSTTHLLGLIQSTTEILMPNEDRS